MEVDTLTMQTVNKTALEMLLKMFRRELEGSIQTTGRMAMATLQREQCPPVQVKNSQLVNTTIIIVVFYRNVAMRSRYGMR